MNAPTLFSYLPREVAETLCKLAEDAGTKPSALKPILAGAAGIGLGTLAGAGAAHLSNKLYKHYSGKDIPVPHLLAAAPVLGAGLGLAYNLAHAHQIEAMRKANSPDK